MYGTQPFSEKTLYVVDAIRDGEDIGLFKAKFDGEDVDVIVLVREEGSELHIVPLAIIPSETMLADRLVDPIVGIPPAYPDEAEVITLAG